jgi:hypothetical protein
MHRTSILLKALVIEHASDDMGTLHKCQHYYPRAYECIGECDFETTHMALRGIQKETRRMH